MGEGGQKIQTSSYKQISHGAITVTIVNNIVSYT